MDDIDLIKRAKEKVLSEEPEESNEAIRIIVSKQVSPRLFVYELIDKDKLATDALGIFQSTQHESQWNTLAIAYWQNKLTTFAIEIFQKLLNRGSTNPATLHNFGIVMYERNAMKSYELVRRARDIDIKIHKEDAKFAPAARYLATIESSITSLKRYRTLSKWLSITASYVILLLVLPSIISWLRPPDPSWDNAEKIISSLIQVDGFVFAFVGTFSIFILERAIASPFRNDAITTAIFPLIVWTSVSIMSGLIELLFESPMEINFLLVPIVALVAALAMSFLLLRYASLIEPSSGTPQQI